MGTSFSLLSWISIDVMRSTIWGMKEVEAVLSKSLSFGENEAVKMTLRSLSFKRNESGIKSKAKGPDSITIERSLSFKNWEPAEETNRLEISIPFNKPEDLITFKAAEDQAPVSEKPSTYLNRQHSEFSSPRPLSERDAAAVKLQKVYKSYRTRRNLADCAVVVEELWWKALDFASLKHSSISFFDVEKPESAVSRWARARTRAAKVGKGLSKDEKAQKLALQHWLEAIDPRHRYGHNLHLYYDVWFESESTEPFFYWLDVGDGREVNLDKCRRSNLQQQCIEYLGPKEREAYEVIVEDGKLVYKQREIPVNTAEGSKWIFVLSTTRALYVGQKKKGSFQHSSFLSGGATTAAGRMVVKEGILQAIWPYSGHYLPTEENFKEFISFLQDNNVDLTNVKRCSVDDDEFPSINITNDQEIKERAKVVEKEPSKETSSRQDAFALGRRLSCKWSTGTGPRIGCVRDYPTELQFKALEQVNLSPRVIPSPMGNKIPIPSPRPSPRIRLSPRLAYMGIPTPTVSLTLPKSKRL
ncbi:IQ domain-containing protein IQM1 [Asparagus officinalis]|uniref:IQ domain-containing protein IQM1 n=1 Tax=Asparagus officinalis TaxID=4686 RepID=UPI00098DE523|nr:IQ domain-containing protein IQM1 [Asparagus officinalis]